MLSLDFSKAFDKACHEVILAAASRFNLPRFIQKWLKNFVSDRIQRVRWNNALSSWSPISSGVPQGSVLGPILFSMIVDSFRPASGNSSVIKYADDITILHFVRSSSDDELQKEWENAIAWSSANRLPLNLTKCKILDIVTKNTISVRPVVTFEGNALPQVDTLKILGVTFSSDLKWNIHVRNVVSKASSRIYIIRNLKRSDCSKDLLYRAYVSFIRSVLLYAYPSFCNMTAYLRQELSSVEKRVMKIIGSNCDKPDLLTFADFTCSKFFKMIEYCKTHPLRIMFRELPESCTRRKFSLGPPCCKTKRLHNSFIKYSRP